MDSQKFVQELVQGKQALVSQLANTEAQIKELKAHRKALRLQIANQDGALAAVQRLEAEEAKADDS
jgi:uncharacterized protein YdbL (DUF1318 family)